MRKRLAFFVGEVGRDFQKYLSKQLKKLAYDKGYDFFIFNNFGSHTSTYFYDVGEQQVIDIPNMADFAGIIMIPDTFDLDGMEDLLLAKIESEATCPVVSIRNGSDKTYRVVVDDYQTSYTLTKHFIEHGYKNICYMSGPQNVSDALLRLNGYKDAMRDAGLEVPEDAVFEGDFWNFLSKPATNQFLNAYGGKTEAIIFANDFMAIGVCEELKKRGIRIPEDIAVCGYDETIEGQGYNPMLTTVKTPTDEFAIQAIEIIERVNSGVEVPDVTPVLGQIMYNQSCGCENNSTNTNLFAMHSRFANLYIDIRSSSYLIADIQNHISEEDKLSFISAYADRLNIEKLYLCLCTQEENNDDPYSEKMLLKSVLPLSDDNSNLAVGNVFTRRLILPEGAYDTSTPKCFIINPIHHRDTTFGYMVTEWMERDFTMFLAPVTAALALAYDDLRLQEAYSEYIEIKNLNLLDPLTNVFNRRGLDQTLNSLISNNTVIDSDIVSFISADLDNLKYINDTFGHYGGDVAIELVANVLSDLTYGEDIVARTGGDEFVIVLTSSDQSVHDNFISNVYDELSKRNKRESNPFDVHVSMGIATTSKDNIKNFAEHMHIADKRMYEAKLAYKKSLKGQ